MLKEKLVYQEGLPVNCSVVQIEDYPIHFHDDLEIVFVLDGQVALKNGYYNYTLKKGDIFIMNDREIHSYTKLDGPNVIMILQLDLNYFNKYYDFLKNCFFVTDMDDEEDESLERLRSLLSYIGLETLVKELGSAQKIIESGHNLIDSLVNDFQYYAMEDGKFVNESKSKGNKILTERVNRITDYMYENYMRRLTLKEIAEREHLSIFYLSHVIKEATGLSYQELLNFIRVEESEKLLLGTDKKIGVISVDSGFSAVRYYIKYFTKWFGMEPTEYRTTYTGHVRGRTTSIQATQIPQEQIEKLFCQYIGDSFTEYMGGAPLVETIEQNLHLTKVKMKRWPDSRMNELLEREELRPAMEGFALLARLKEREIATGAHYIVTGGTRRGTDSKGQFSVLLFHFGENFLGEDIKIKTSEQVRDYINKYDEKLEMLIKLHGLAGEYRIARYRFTKEAILSKYRKLLGEKEHGGPREELVRNWTSTPVSTIEHQYASEGLFLQSQLKGFGAELILIDAL